MDKVDVTGFEQNVGNNDDSSLSPKSGQMKSVGRGSYKVYPLKCPPKYQCLNLED